MAGTVVMALAGLAVGYIAKGEKKSLIKNLNLDVRRGEVVCLLGQNGVGKSTLLRTIAGIQPPLEGSIFFNERNLTQMNPQELAWRISIVLTEKVTAGNLSVYDLVALGRYPYTNWLGILSTADKATVDEAIALTNINYLSEKKIGELSDGQYQKAMIARAVAQDGELMILDEPTAFLDLNNSVEIFLLLRKLAYEKNKAVVVSTHDFHLAMQFADRLWLTNFNSPLYEGLPEDLAVSGRLEESMFHKGFELDLLNGRVILPAGTKASVSLVAGMPAYEWTRRALERDGYSISEGNDSMMIESFSKENIIYWQVGRQKFASIQALLGFLNNRIPQADSL